jgi:VWFA-related protein
VTGLTADRFDLLDNGVAQKTEVVTLEDVPLHLFLVLDASDSVTRDLDALKQAARAAIAALRPGDRATLLTFSHELQLAAEGPPGDPSLTAAIARIEAYGSSSLHDAVVSALMLRGEPGASRAVMLVFSDSADTTSWLRASVVRDDIRRSDVVVYGVTARTGGAYQPDDDVEGALHRRSGFWQGFGADPELFRRALLFALTDDSGGQLFSVDRGTDLGRTFASVVDEFKSRYLLLYTPEGVAADGWHRLEVKLRGVRGEVQARRGYQR